jgi:hypothetical protein
MNDWEKAGINEGNVKEKVKQFLEKKASEGTLFTDEEIKKWTEESTEETSKICALIYGQDGTGKSGIALDFLTEEDIKKGNKVLVIDLDGGSRPLKETYHLNKGKNLIVLNPLCTFEAETGTEIDYLRTFGKIRAIIRYVRDNYKKEKIKAIIFDGLSTALTYAEQQMRVERHLDPDGGVQTRFWMLRNKLFLETLEQIKVLPIAKIFIGHENFISSEDPTKKTSSVIMKTSAMMFQKIKCQRINNPNSIEFIATIDKSKYSVKSEGQRIVFCEVNKAEKSFRWDTKKIFECLS